MPAIYPDGSALMNVNIMDLVAYGLQVAAAKRRLSRSQLVNMICEDWLNAKGELPKPEEVPA